MQGSWEHFVVKLLVLLQSNPRYRQIGIRGDCIYAIYSAPQKHHLESILSDAIFYQYIPKDVPTNFRRQ